MVSNLCDGKLVIGDRHALVYDNRFKDFLYLKSNLEEFKSAYKESPEFFTPEILICLFHFLMTSEFAEAYEIIEETERRIVGRDNFLNIDYALNLVGDGYEWVDYSRKDQEEIMCSNIIKRLQK